MTVSDSVRRRILVVDDDMTTRTSLQRQLREAEFEVILGSDSDELFGRLPEYAPDVILVNAGDEHTRCLEL